ncbi:hypothetical protein [Pseudobdellovibrio exovorus]|uniref:Uncharacterized protein n=1 Tax=Pseudobdellovibrio exovorus JSS TaxID=1184267 RepID=M4VBI9_9BACT|nr:hypothetical protein [Pseudobdellovibrio exovorus]AGH96762.1 hypothetical protein A11Q_2546 [Pseudobdellovibrio exovorus JSS]
MYSKKDAAQSMNSSAEIALDEVQSSSPMLSTSLPASLSTAHRKISLPTMALFFFAVLGLCDIFFPFAMTPAQRLFLDFAALYGFASAVHVIFPIWLMERSGDFRELVETNVGPIQTVRFKLLLIFLAFCGSIFAVCYYGSPFWVKTVLLAQAIWGVWHYLTQTRGLYHATVLRQPRSVYQHTLNVLKVFVLVIFGCRMLRMGVLAYELQNEKVLYYIGISLYWVAALLLGYILIRTALIRTSEGRQFWVLSRFFMWLMTAFTPISAYGVNAIHGAEYYELTRKIEDRSLQKRTNHIFAVGFLSFLFLFGLLGIFEITRFFEEYRLLSAAILAFSLSVSNTHFVLDGWIYKMKNEQSRVLMKRFLQ